MSKNTRTYTWEAPTAVLEEAKNLTGYEILVRVLEGTLPQAPTLDTIGSTLRTVEKGQAVFELQPSVFLYNLIGTIHGGVISTVLDTAIGCSLLTTLAAGESFTSLDLKVNFLKKITKDSPVLHTHTTIIHQGRTTAYMESRLLDQAGTVYAHAVSTCMIFR
ncbi:PaaI family thioesterase [Myroides sp. C15-4]|uniref:PaaI family thioesterase n=1 Tax=Myroides sp. C15-4 TaxID=3400532 RepID=UPI003D2F6F7D